MTVLTNYHGEYCLSDFDFIVPEELIAQELIGSRDESRMIVREQNGGIEHLLVNDLVKVLPPDTLVVWNNSKVFPSRLLGKSKFGGSVEIFLLEMIDQGKNTWRAIGKPMKKFKLDSIISFDYGLEATVTGLNQNTRAETDTIAVSFNLPSKSMFQWLEQFAYVPLPPYIHREQLLPAGISKDKDNYQTVYAEVLGSVAAPTAGLHFSVELIEKLKRRGVSICEITLHVGLGTFMPVKTEMISEHLMHKEQYFISKETLLTINKAKRESKPILAVGTTAFRCLEDFFSRFVTDEQQMSHVDQECFTDLFIFPRKNQPHYRPKVADILLTNFHQPHSTLFMLVCALIGVEQAKMLYDQAVTTKYHFFSYGDCSLLKLSL